VLSGGRAARAIPSSRASLPLKSALCSAPGSHFANRPRIWIVALASILVTGALCHAQSTSGPRELPDAPVFAVVQGSPVAEDGQTRDVVLIASSEDLTQAPAPQSPPPAAPDPATPPAAQAPATQDNQAPASGIAPDLKGQSEQGKEQVAKQEKQRVLGVIPAFNSVYEGTVPPLTPSQKMKLMWKSTTDIYVFAFAAVTAGIGQAQNSHAAYGQGVEGYAKRFGANYADTADGNFWGNAILPIVLHEDPRYFRLGHGSFTHRFLYGMSTTVWCKRDNGTSGPNYANVIGNFIAGGISNVYYPAADRGIEQTVQSALTVTAEGIIGAELIEFWPDIAHHYKVKKQAKLDAADAAARKAQAANPNPNTIAPQ
jgi:hypothetical protein